MMTLPTVAPSSDRNPGTPINDCWNRIGVHGDRSCPELITHIHCHNCPIFSAAGRRFLDAPTPEGYLDEWTQRLASSPEEWSHDLLAVLIFRLADEWLAVPLSMLVEVTQPRPMHRVPHRGGVLAGMVSVRGELFLCAHLTKAMGMLEPSRTPDTSSGTGPRTARMLVVRHASERWVLSVDEVEQVHRVPKRELRPPPATVGRAVSHLARGVFTWNTRAVGLLDEDRLFDDLRSKLR